MRYRAVISSLVVFSLLVAANARATVHWAPDTSDSTQLKSLRGAVIFANKIGGDNTILLGSSPGPRFRQTQPWVYHLTIHGANEDQAKTGDLDITRGHLTIIGVTPNVVIDATGLGDRVFQVFSNASLTLVNVTIKGGMAPTNISGFDNMMADGGAIYNSGTLNLQNCRLVDNASGFGGLDQQFISLPGGDGGAIYNEGHAQLDNCTICFNQTGGAQQAIYSNSGGGASGGDGGGIYNTGDLTLNRCLIATNLCGTGGPGALFFGDGLIIIPVGMTDSPSGRGGDGGGVFNSGNITISYSTVANNRAGDGGNNIADENSSNGGSGGDGGGVFNNGSFAFNTSTISGNIAGDGGPGADNPVEAGGSGGNGGNAGGIYNSGTLNLSACTVAINQAGVGAAAGSVLYTAGSLASAPSGGQGGSGGGIFNAATGLNVVVCDSLVALNIPNVGGVGSTNQVGYFPPVTITGAAGATGTGSDISGAFTSQGFNLISTGDGGTGFTNDVNSDQVGTDADPINPVLGPLQWNGGPTPTHALLPGSPAINQGFDFGTHTDQRGYPRPYLYPGIPKAPNGDGSDIGAFELEGQ